MVSEIGSTLFSYRLLTLTKGHVVEVSIIGRVAQLLAQILNVFQGIYARR